MEHVSWAQCAYCDYWVQVVCVYELGEYVTYEQLCDWCFYYTGDAMDINHWWCWQPNPISDLRSVLMNVLPNDMRLIEVVDRIAIFTTGPYPAFGHHWPLHSLA